MTGPLEGIRVVDLSQYIAGPNCTRFLAGFGADVIKVESPGGDPLRRWGLETRVEAGASEAEALETNPLHLYLDQGKRSITLDLEYAEDRETIEGLLATADVLVESGRPGALAGLGLDFASVSSRHPGLVYLSVTPFGQDGPYAGFNAWEITSYALSGLMAITGDPEREPLKNGGYLGQYGAGQNAFAATLAALWERERSGLGQHVDVSVHECATSLTEMTDMTWIYGGRLHPRAGNGARAAWGLYPCRDGFVGVVSGPAHRWARISELMENPALDEPRYQAPGAQSALRDEIDALMLPWLIEHDKEEIYRRAQDLGFPFGYVATPADFFASEQLAYRGFFHEVDHPVAGRLKYPSMAAHFSEASWESRRAPLLGEHTAEVRAEGWRPRDERAPRPPETSHAPVREGQRGPLEGLLVLDCSMVWAGPYATKLLGDMGATIVKIEASRHFDSVRGQAIPPTVPISSYLQDTAGDDPWNRAGYFNKYNRNKLGISMNILTPEGREAFMALAAVADVVIENFGGGVFERMGYGYDAIRAVNEDVVFVSMPPSGNGGPEATYVGYGVAIEQLGGIVARTGYRGDMPMKSGINYGDPIAGIHTAGYILAALHHRHRTGRGTCIDLSQRECSICWVAESVLDYQLTGREPEPMGNRDDYMAPVGVYRAAGEDEWLAIATGSDAEWAALARAIGRPELAQAPEYATWQARMARHDELDAVLAAWTAPRDAIDAMRELQAAGVAAAYVANNRQTVEDPHLNASGFWPEVEHASGVRHPVAGVAWQFSRTPGAVYAPAPALGQHTDYVLRELLGYDDARIAALREAGVLEDVPAEVLAKRAAEATAGVSADG